MKHVRLSLLTLVLISSLQAADAVKKFPWSDTTKPYGIDKRVPWTTSKVVGTPDPLPPYTVERVFPHLRFERSLEITNGPDGKRWFICEDPGLIYSFPKDQNVEKADLFLDIRRKDYKFLPWQENRRLWGLAFHANFSKNGYVYVCYLEPKPSPQRCRISRFTVENKTWGTPVADPDSEYVILDWLSVVDHHGGCLRFGSDGYLYFSAGDGSAHGDGNNSGQDISDFNAAIMRIDVDNKQNGKAYAIPADNPFVNVPGARGEVYAYGLRNVWKMSFDKKTNDLWAGDVGQDLWDSVFRVEKGGNYGWSVVEGTHPFRTDRKVGPTPILPPVIEHDHSEMRSVTGGYVYHGTRLPELTGCYIYGDYETGRFYAFRWDGKKATEAREIAQTTLHIVAFGEDIDGELLLLDYVGTISRLIPTPKAEPRPPFPTKLSQTGLFASTKDHIMAPGVIPYNVNSPLWSDHAIKDRYIALPGDSKIDFDPNGTWRFPEGTVLVKSFAMQMKAGDPASNKRLETRLLHLENGQWQFYTYVWNDAQDDAELLGKGSLEKKLEISDPSAPNGTREQIWHFPSRNECTLCHTAISGFALGPTTAQLNRDFNFNGVTDNQLRAFDHIDLFKNKIANYYRTDEKNPDPQVAKLADPKDDNANLDARARSYLHANCTHCHRMYGGGNSTFQLQHWLSFKDTATNVPPAHGDMGLKDARIIAPGAPERSVLLYRMNKLGDGRMPHVASTVVDEPAVKLIREWITQLK